jgi:ADP-heptose:LPS heptosyltransferase
VISFFTSLKPFRGTTGVQQRNALRSWRASIPDCEIIVFGAVEGGEDLLAELEATYRPDIECNEFGTPLISAMFADAQRIGRHSVLCYINGDIILLSGFAGAIAQLTRWRMFAAVGQCWGLDLTKPIDFLRTGWDTDLRASVMTRGKIRSVTAMDFFAFRRGAVGQLPPFAIGRPAWDNYLVKHLLSRRIPVVDLSLATKIVHQNHDYAHIPQGCGSVWEGPEATRNYEVADQGDAGFVPGHYSVRNAQWLLINRVVVPALSPSRVWWRCRPAIPFSVHKLLYLASLLPRSGTSLRRLMDFYVSTLFFRFFPRDPHHVAVVRLDNIGDFVLWLDGARALRKRYPRPMYKLTLIAAAAWSDFAEASRLFDEVISVDPRRFATDRSYCRQISRKVARYRFATAINPTFSRSPWIDDFLLGATGASARIGCSGDLSNSSRLVQRITNRWYSKLVPNDDAATHELQKNWNFAKQFGYRAPLRVPELEPAMVHRPIWLPTSSDYFVLFPASAWAIKLWPVDRFGEIAIRIHAQTGWSGIVCGLASDSIAAKNLIANASGVPIMDACGRTNLQELAGVIAEAKLVVTNDTSAAHLAAALERPTVVILGGGHFGRFLPYPDAAMRGSQNFRAAYQSMPCYHCNWHCVHPLQPGDPGPCITKVSVDDVWALIQPMLALEAAPPGPSAEVANRVTVTPSSR